MLLRGLLLRNFAASCSLSAQSYAFRDVITHFYEMVSPFAWSAISFAMLSFSWCKWGVWGEGPGGAGSPHSCSAKIDLWHRGPWRAPVPHEAAGSVRSPSRRMMEMPLGFRVSGCFGTKHPIKNHRIGHFWSIRWKILGCQIPVLDTPERLQARYYEGLLRSPE